MRAAASTSATTSTRTSGQALPTIAAVVVVAALAAGCPPPKTQPAPEEPSRRGLTANVADGIYVPRLEAFVARAAELRAATDALAASPGDDEARDAARTAWRAAMDPWQELEMLHVGPAGSPASATGSGFTGGAGLRERIYVWPYVSPCSVDAQILGGTFEADGWADVRLPNVIGLSAVEYTLFRDDDGNACPADNEMNTGGAWAALGATEVAARRAKYAAVVAADVEAKAIVLRDAWTGDDGFAATLRTAGQDGSVFSTAQQALDEIYAALFAVELLTKDQKLGLPAGLRVECEAESCPEKAESFWSRTSKENIARNLDAVRRVFVGVDVADAAAIGFDDLLVDQDQQQLADDMIAALDGAIAATAAFDGTLEDALKTEPARARALYDAVKVFTDELKGAFSSALGLRVPAEGGGDND